MNITYAQYAIDKATNENIAIKATIDGVRMPVPINTENRHYAAILEWVAEGNTIAEAD